MSKMENPFNYGTDVELHRMFEAMISLKNRVAESFAKAEKLAGFSADVKFKPLEEFKLDNMLPNYRARREPSSSWSSSAKTKLEVIDAEVKAAVEKARAYIEEVNERNLPLMEHNKQIASQVTELMLRLGIPQSYTTYEYPTTRSKTKKSVVHTAGFVGDLQRVSPTSGYSAVKYRIDGYLNEYKRWAKAEKEAETKAEIERDEAAVKKNILGNPDLVATLMQAGVNILDEANKALPGKKSQVIEYCIVKAISNVRSSGVEFDSKLLAKLEHLHETV